MKKLTPEQASQFVEDCCSFKSYSNIEEYIEDIVVCLIYSPWRYTEERAREQVEERKAFVERFYKEKVPADDAAADVGYSCG